MLKRQGLLSHLTDQLEFYLLIDYLDDVDQNEKLAVWEEFSTTDRIQASTGSRSTRGCANAWYHEEC